MARKEKPEKKTAGQSHREQAAARSRERSQAVADIGDLPKVAKPRRKAGCKKDLHRFLVSYFPHSLGLKPLSEKQKEMIRSIQERILKGGRALHRFPRGFVKTSISEGASIWATLYGHRQFVPIFGASKVAADSIIESIKIELSENDLLYEDFPEVCHGIRALEGKVQRCRSQTYRGALTYIEWAADTIVLPTIPKSAASGAVIMAKPIRAARGMRHKCPDGEIRRPDFFIVDDPQTDDGARSPIVVKSILQQINKAICRAGSHSKPIAGVVNATPICRDDVVDCISNPKLFPAWNVMRAKMLESFAEKEAHEKHWLGEYARLRNNFDRSNPADQRRAKDAATAYYKKNRKEMDRGAKATWDECYSEEDGEISAVQHALNILIDDGEEVFASECQDEPKKPDQEQQRLTAGKVLQKLCGLKRGLVPKECEHVTAYVDVHERLLYYVVSAWSTTFTGRVIDYGTYPEQSLSYFAQATAPISMATAHPGLVEDAWILAGLSALIDGPRGLLCRPYQREDGITKRIDRLLIDIKWGEKNKLLRAWCRRHPQHGTILHAAQGIGIGPGQIPMSDYKPDGAEVGPGWRNGPPKGGDIWISIDTNWWKSQVASRLLLPVSTPGGIELFGLDPREHLLLADHCVAEEPVRTAAKGRESDVWQWRPGRPDNHYWDCLVGSAVAASKAGVKIPGVEMRRRTDPKNRPTAAQLAGRR